MFISLIHPAAEGLFSLMIRFLPIDVQGILYAFAQASATIGLLQQVLMGRLQVIAAFGEDVHALLRRILAEVRANHGEFRYGQRNTGHMHDAVRSAVEKPKSSARSVIEVTEPVS